MAYLRKHLSYALQGTCRMNEGVLQDRCIGFCVVRKRLAGGLDNNAGE